MNRVIAATLLSTSLVLVSCAARTVPTSQQAIAADYGSVVTPADCRSIAQAAIQARIGGNNTQVTFDAPCGRNWVRAIPESGLPIEYGFYQTGTVNVGNGVTNPYYVLIRDGRAIRAAISEQSEQVTVWRP